MFFVNVDGAVRLAVEEINTKCRRAILFVHGWPLSRKIFESQYAVIPEYGIRCIGMDLRGFGDSDKPWRGYSYDRMADDLCRVIQSIDCNCLTLCGFSMGGAICVRYMARYGGAKVSRLILCGSASPSFVQKPGYPYGMTREQVDCLIEGAYENRPKTCADFARTCFYKNPGDYYLEWFRSCCYDAAGYATIKAAESLRDEDLRCDLGKIRVPTAILHGVHDMVCPYAFAEEMRQGIANSFIVPFENSGHCLFFEEKDKFNSTLVDFAAT